MAQTGNRGRPLPAAARPLPRAPWKPGGAVGLPPPSISVSRLSSGEVAPLPPSSSRVRLQGPLRRVPPGGRTNKEGTPGGSEGAEPGRRQRRGSPRPSAPRIQLPRPPGLRAPPTIARPGSAPARGVPNSSAAPTAHPAAPPPVSPPRPLPRPAATSLLGRPRRAMGSGSSRSSRALRRLRGPDSRPAGPSGAAPEGGTAAPEEASEAVGAAGGGAAGTDPGPAAPPDGREETLRLLDQLLAESASWGSGEPTPRGPTQPRPAAGAESRRTSFLFRTVTTPFRRAGCSGDC